MKAVMDPKIMGAWNLHLQTLPMRLDFFVCFSSIASVFGNADQANYSAANAFLDSLSAYRHSIGLPALTGRDANATPPFDAFDFQNPPFVTPPNITAHTTVPANVLQQCGQTEVPLGCN
jgi:hypothetical protein